MPLASYRVARALGDGRFGRAALAADQSGREVVLKRVSLRKALASRQVTSLSGPDAAKVLELFRREAKVLATLRHPGIPTLLDSFEEQTEDDLELCLVQERVEATPLSQRLAESLDERTILEIGRQVAEILAYLHSRVPPVVHRDIKPSNLLLSPSGRVYLIDFGAVTDADLAPEGGSTVVGTYGYMPLEQYEGRASPASDVYALGMTLATLVTGREPSEQVRRDGRLVLEGTRAGPRLAKFIRAMTESEVSRRPRDGSSALRMLERRPLGFRRLLEAGAVSLTLFTAVVLALHFQSSSATNAQSKASIDTGTGTASQEARPAQPDPLLYQEPAVAQPAALLSVLAQPWCDVWVDGRRLGETPVLRSRLAPGRHVLTFVNPDPALSGVKLSQAVNLQAGKNKVIEVDMAKREVQVDGD